MDDMTEAVDYCHNPACFENLKRRIDRRAPKSLFWSVFSVVGIAVVVCVVIGALMIGDCASEEEVKQINKTVTELKDNQMQVLGEMRVKQAQGIAVQEAFIHEMREYMKRTDKLDTKQTECNEELSEWKVRHEAGHD